MVKQTAVALALICLLGVLAGCHNDTTSTATPSEAKAFGGTPPTERSKQLTQQLLMKAAEAQQRQRQPLAAH